MAQQPIRSDDGAAYDRGMGVWSQLVGQVFLDWLAPITGLRWIDIGCGSGAFTELLARRSAPVELQGIDPFEEQLAFARSRVALPEATFREGDAMALPFETDRFDAAVMALVLFFVPYPGQGRRGDGPRSASRWHGGGLPLASHRNSAGSVHGRIARPGGHDGTASQR